MPQTQRQTDRDAPTDRDLMPIRPSSQSPAQPPLPANENATIDAHEFWRRLGL